MEQSTYHDKYLCIRELPVDRKRISSVTIYNNSIRINWNKIDSHPEIPVENILPPLPNFLLIPPEYPPVTPSQYFASFATGRCLCSNNASGGKELEY